MSRLAGEKQRTETRRFRPRLNLTLDEPAHRMLQRVENASRFVEQLVLEHDRTWRAALEQLVAAGFRSRELFAVTEIVPGTMRPEDVVATLQAGAPKACAAFKIRPGIWAERVRALERDPYLALAVLELARAAWSGHLDVCDAIEHAAA